MKTLLENFLRQTGMTRVQLSKETGISEATLCRILSGKVKHGSAVSYRLITQFINGFFTSGIKVIPDGRKNSCKKQQHCNR